jgi:hypothetical protein
LDRGGPDMELIGKEGVVRRMYTNHEAEMSVDGAEGVEFFRRAGREGWRIEPRRRRRRTMGEEKEGVDDGGRGGGSGEGYEQGFW